MAAVVLAAMGCAEVHTLPDAGIDAGGRDSDPPDAWTCVDRDGDGALDARCGGDDCDDEDAEISPDRGPCADATHLVRCVDGARASVACTSELPECDARAGECVAAGGACGDAVVHASEECDDASDADTDGCAPDCRFGTCPRDARCHVPGAPWCIRQGDPPDPICTPGNPGGSPLGTHCELDSECESGWCGPFDRRCTFFCYDTPDCADRGGWCDTGFAMGEGFGGVSPPAPAPNASLSCVWPCETSEDCDAGEACTVVLALIAYGDDVRLHGGATWCAPIAGALPAGAPCSSAEQCSTNVCIDGACTQVCHDDADCVGGPGRTCAPVEHLARRSPPFPTPFVMVCR